MGLPGYPGTGYTSVPALQSSRADVLLCTGEPEWVFHALWRVKIDFLVSVWSHQKSLIIKQEGVPRRTLAMLLY